MSRSAEDWLRMANVSSSGYPEDESSEGAAGSRYGEPPHDPVIGRDKDGGVTLPRGVRPVEVIRVVDAPEPDPREYVLEGLIPEGAATSLYGDGGVAKSLLAMSICCSVSRGEDFWMGYRAKGCAALYMDFELTADEQIRRAKALCRGSGYSSVPEELHYMSALGYASEDAFWSAYKAANDHGVGLVVIDSFGLAQHGEAESATDVIEFYRTRLEPFVSDGISVLMIDHQAKGGENYQRRTSFGSVYKRNLVRSELQVEALDQDEDSGTLDLVFRHTKHNFGPRLRPFGAQVGFHEDEIRVGPLDLDPSRMVLEEGMKATDRVLLAMSDLDVPATADTVAEHTQMNLKTVRNVMVSLERRGKIRATGDRVGKFSVMELMPDSPVTYKPQPVITDDDEEMVF